MSSGQSQTRPAVRAVRPAVAATLFVCKRCSDGPGIRRELAAAVKKAGDKRRLRVVACGCLDVCPKRGTAAFIAPAGGQGSCVVIDAAARIDAAFVRGIAAADVS